MKPISQYADEILSLDISKMDEADIKAAFRTRIISSMQELQHNTSANMANALAKFAPDIAAQIVARHKLSKETLDHFVAYLRTCA